VQKVITSLILLLCIKNKVCIVAVKILNQRTVYKNLSISKYECRFCAYRNIN